MFRGNRDKFLHERISNFTQNTYVEICNSPFYPLRNKLVSVPPMFPSPPSAR